jgi:hypothetical protein
VVGKFDAQPAKYFVDDLALVGAEEDDVAVLGARLSRIASVLPLQEFGDRRFDVAASNVR